MFDCSASSECVAACIFMQVIRIQELVSQLVFQQEASVSRISEEPLADSHDHSSEHLDVTMHNGQAKSQGEDGVGEDVPQIYDLNGKNGNKEFPSKSSVWDFQKDHEKGHSIENTRQKGKAKVAKESQVSHNRTKKQRVFQKSNGNLLLSIKGRYFSVSELQSFSLGSQRTKEHHCEQCLQHSSCKSNFPF